ncbi:hypothetical protein ACLI09_10360 [Flavobacterium sp. RHBU_24]|uniref:hypothetical protein n=1 Tax=Flavobacterium sp. RHBU_24 TaxID=3391185 RepID=UPI0039846239
MNKLLYIFLFLSLTITAQKRQDFRGQVLSGGALAGGIFVINKTTGVETKTDANGIFSLDVRAGDRIVVFSDYTKVREFDISSKSFEEQPYKMEVEAKGTELNEVVVQGENLSEEEMGIVPEGQKQYTVAERRKRANRTLSLNQGINLGLDGVGKKKMLRENISTEDKLTAVENLRKMYTQEEITEYYGIPADNVEGFMFYAAEDAACMQALKANSLSTARPQLKRLSQEYIKMLEDGE